MSLIENRPDVTLGGFLILLNAIDIKKFQKIHERVYGSSISQAEATRLAHRLIALYKAVLIPNKKDFNKKK